jgi:predicted amidohydrolase YtcJ
VLRRISCLLFCGFSVILFVTACTYATEPITPTPTKILTPIAQTTQTPVPSSTSTLLPIPSLTRVPSQTATTTSSPTPVTPADMIFYNGMLITIDKSQPRAQAIAIRHGMIQAVGTDEQILTLQGPATSMINLGGQTMMPGFVDSHTHIFNDATYRLGIDYLQAQQLALRNGITTVGDMWSDADFVEKMRTLDNSWQLHVRTSIYLLYNNACGQLTGDWYKQYPPTRGFGEMLRIGGLKLMADGGVCGSPALSYCRSDIGCYGDLWFTQAEMNTMVESLDTEGYQLAVHAFGDRAIEQVLNAFELVLDGRHNTLRHRIEHNATLRPDIIPRYALVDPVATIFGSFWACISNSNPVPEGYQTTWEWPYRALRDANPDLHIAWHSDYPWVGPASPLLHLFSMVTPYEIFTDDKTQCVDTEWLPGKTFTVEEVLPMMTIEGAYALFRDDEVGSLEAGKFADLIVLSGDPTAIDPMSIKNLEVWMTMVGGEVEWCAPGHEEHCPSTP